MDRPPRKRVAVIAVHGIGDHAPGETVRTVADMLLRRSGFDGARYSSCEEASLRIPTQPVHLAEKTSMALAAQPKPTRSDFEERSDYVLRLHQRRPHALAAKAAGPENDYGYHFMREQLRQYVPRDSERIYESQRLVTIRSGPEPEDVPHEVHLFEMYWADLSRPGNQILRIVADLYLLLFHLSSLGRQTIDFALAEHVADSSAEQWRTLSWLHTLANRLLTLVMPVVNLLLCLTILPVLLAGLPDSWAAPPAIAGSILAGVVVCGARQRRRSVTWLWLLVAPLLYGLSGCALAAGLNYLQVVGYWQLLMILWLLLAASGLIFVSSRYNRERPGANRIAIWTGVPVALYWLILVFCAGNAGSAMVTVAVMLTEGIASVLGLSWCLLIAIEILTFWAGFRAVWATSGSAAVRSRAWRAAETAWIMLSLPTLLLLVVTLIAYSGLVGLGTHFVPALDKIPYLAWLPFSSFNAGGVTAFLWHLIATAETPVLLVALGLLLAASLLAAWGLFPAVLSDLRPQQSGTATAAQDSQWLGGRLNSAYQLLYGSAGLIVAACPFVLAVGWVIQMARRAVASSPLAVVATAAVAAAGGLLAFNGGLQKLALGFRPVLDALLDIDKYLREHPRSDNLRSRICCRYISLLRYLCQWRDVRDGGKYSAVIIVAHSQGTVISAELLRFLQREPDPALSGLGELPDAGEAPPPAGDRVPLYLFTLGCPLRQLYGWRFPHLYLWARHVDQDDWADDRPLPDLPANQLPDAAKLGVIKWVNAFRSGDYVGRYLWRVDRCAYEWQPGRTSYNHSQRQAEFCLGVGGHIHYFDDSALPIAIELDRLISNVFRAS